MSIFTKKTKGKVLGGLAGMALGPAGAIAGGAIGGGALSNKAKTPEQLAYEEFQRQQMANAMEFQRNLNPIQTQQLSAIGSQLTALNNAPTAETQANVEVERRRRAMAVGQEGATRDLNRGIARRGLANSAAGLFAQSRADQSQANQLADLESSRLGMQQQFQDLATQRRTALLGQLGGLQQMVQLPGLEGPNMDRRSGLMKFVQGAAPYVAQFGGQAVGAYAGGGSGAAAKKKKPAVVGTEYAGDSSGQAVS